ncbi:MAG: hypothetical protein GWP08_04405 [Nitrospiraceae bacterium]|nr:hypothetical protein [Nitrospiraceae bacterium]
MKSTLTLASMLIVTCGSAFAWVDYADTSSTHLDTLAPTATITRDASTPTTADSVAFSVDFNENVGATFTSADVSASSGSLLANVVVTGTDPNYTVTATFDDPNADGTYGIDIGTNVEDAFGNGYAGDTSPAYTIHNWPGFTTEPQDARAYTGGANAYQVAADFAPITPTFQWWKDDGLAAALSGETNDTLNIDPVGAADVADYWCEVTYDGTLHASNTGALSVADHLAVDAPPAGASKYVGDPYTFTVTTTGGHLPLAYTWLHDASPSGSAQSYVIASAALGDAGAYVAQIDDDLTDSVQTTAVQLNIEPRMAVTTQPAGASKYVGDAHTFTVAAEGGYAPLAYTWRKNGGNVASGTSYFIPSLVAGDAAAYDAVVNDNLTDQETSQTAQLLVEPRVSITTQPTGASKYVGDAHTFTVAADGGYAPLVYTWRKNGSNVASGTTYPIPSLVSGDAAAYDAVVNDNETDQESSATAQLFVEPHVSITQHPVGARKYVGDSHTFTVAAEGGYTPFAYEWRKGATVLGSGSSYTIASLLETDEGWYKARVSDSVSDVLFSNNPQLFVEPHVSITQQPLGARKYIGDAHTFTVAAEGGYAPLAYQWRKGATVLGAGTSHAIASLVEADAGWYKARVSDSAWDVLFSNNPQLFVEPHVSITQQPVGARKYVGDSHTFTVAAEGGYAPLAYQWSKGATALGAGTSYAIASLLETDAGWYKARVSDSVSDVLFSNNPQLFVEPRISITTQPTGDKKYIGDSHTFTVAAEGGYAPLAYTWRKNGTDVATGTAYTIPSLSEGDAASYDAVVNDIRTDEENSQTAQLFVEPHISITQQPVGARKYIGDSHTFSVAAAGGHAPLSYTWHKDATAVGSGTTYTIPFLFMTHEGWYRAVLHDDATDEVLSDSPQLIVRPHVAITQQPVGARKYVGDSHTFTVASTGGYEPISTVWRKDGVDAAVGNPFTIASLSTEHSASYDAVVSDSLTDSDTSEATVLSIVPHLTITGHPAGAEKQVGASHTFAVATTGGHEPLRYTWKLGDIVLGNGPTLTIANLTVFHSGAYTVEVADDETDVVVSLPAQLTVTPAPVPAAGLVGLGLLCGALGVAALAARRR